MLPQAHLSPERNRRIVVIGTSGSGKTTTASQLARRLGLLHVELDALHWEPNWTEAPLDVFRARVIEALKGDAWVVDGNYSKVRDIVWSRADTVVWLDYSLPVILWRVVWRTLRRSLTREELWGGNRETLRAALFSRESIVLWSLQTYRRRRREYPVLLARPEHAHLAVIHLRSPRAARDWLSGIEAVSDQQEDFELPQGE
jgi:adenylate kinase family enzyme